MRFTCRENDDMPSGMNRSLGTYRLTGVEILMSSSNFGCSPPSVCRSTAHRRSDPPHPASGPADTMRKYVVRRSPAATTAARYPPRPACRAFAVFSKIHASSYSPRISRTAAARKPTDRMRSTCSPNPKSRDADSCRRFCTRWMLPYRHSLSKEMY